jgi:hypothetical protein
MLNNKLNQKAYMNDNKTKTLKITKIPTSLAKST